jgi:fatty-acyl-CoA synthase
VYPPTIAAERPDATAFVMADSGRALTYGEFDRTSNQLAHLLRERGVGAGGSLVLVMENRIEWPVVVAAGMRAGLFVTPLNWHLAAGELAALLAEARPAVVVTSAALRATVAAALAGRAGVVRLCVDGADEGFEDFHGAIANRPQTPIADELLGARVLYSGGTTGRPKVFRQQLLGIHPAAAPARHAGLATKLGIDSSTVLLSPAPNYHAAPFTFGLIVLSLGGTVVCMEKFGAAAALDALRRHGVTHSQWVPTMLVRLLQVPDRDTIELSPAHRVAFTAGAPCPVEVKNRINRWWGPILHEYYGASEGYGHTYISPDESRTHPGSVGRPLDGVRVHIADEHAVPVPDGAVGRVWFERIDNSDNLNGDSHGWRSMGDSGYLDQDGYLYLAGRESFMIISGGVNIYPEEIEEILITHPDVADAAVFGVPDPEFGEQVKAVVELRAGRIAGPDAERRLIEHCRTLLAHFKAPRSVEFTERLPRTPAGKLNKKNLRAQYLTAQ